MRSEQQKEGGLRCRSSQIYFEGNFSNLGTDLIDAPSSLANHPQEIAEVAGGAALLAGGLFFAPELAGLAGFGGAIDASAGAADAALAAGAVDSSVAGLGGDVLAGGDILSSAALGDVSALGGDAAALGGDAAAGAFDLGGAASFNADPAIASYLGGDLLNAADPSIAAAGGDITSADLTQVSDALQATGDTSGAGASVGADSAALPANATVSDIGGAGGGGLPSYPAAGGGSSLTSTLGSTLSSPWTKLALGAAPLALTLGMGETQLPAGAQALQGQALALQQQGLTDLASARAGTLNAGQTAQLAQMSSDLKNKWLQTLYNQGVQDPTKDARWPQIAAQIDAQVTQQTAALIQQNITNALAETGQAASALTSIAQMQMSADTNFTNALINATKSLGLAAGSSAGRTVTIT